MCAAPDLKKKKKMLVLEEPDLNQVGFGSWASISYGPS